MCEIEQKFGRGGESIADVLTRLHYENNQSFSDMETSLGLNPRSTLLKLQLYFGFSIAEMARRSGRSWETLGARIQEKIKISRRGEDKKYSFVLDY